ncbi:hypothetical protein MAQ5080_00790 [Marinomonas aquimarina]|uniref:Polyketide cyclase / dehydrase and lipid transport n=1 Tax=Marinomonas aquimarina TaxID=295068 RepID=A0A1A8T7F7_9GAMM|nr:hypothetical protein [Marinomonas aquimarina]SBS27331.1 hypothetical protein MAQ5080_00790 [Marinomonas aquimarina]
MQPTQALVSLRYVTRIAAVIILMAVAVGFFLPSDYRIERRALAPSAQYDLVQERLYNPEAWKDWVYIESGSLVLQEGGETLQPGNRYLIQYDGEVTKQGSIVINSVSMNEITFTVQPNQKTQPIPNTLQIEVAANGQTNLQWVIEGELDAGFLSPYLAFLANRIAGGNIESSLSNLVR